MGLFCSQVSEALGTHKVVPVVGFRSAVVAVCRLGWVIPAGSLPSSFAIVMGLFFRWKSQR